MTVGVDVREFGANRNFYMQRFDQYLLYLVGNHMLNWWYIQLIAHIQLHRANRSDISSRRVFHLGPGSIAGASYLQELTVD